MADAGARGRELEWCDVQTASNIEDNTRIL